MSHIQFAKDKDLAEIVVVSEDRECQTCGHYLHVRETKRRYVWSSAGPTCLVVQLLHCPDKSCSGHKVTVGVEAELAVALPYWSVTWEVFAWMGHRRFGRHWSVPQIREELDDRFRIEASEDWVEDYLKCYQAMVAAKESDLQTWAENDYQDVQDLILTIDGLQPEKGHETLYVVRELRAKRVWFAQPLLSSSAEEVQRLFERAKGMATLLGKPVRCWMSDKQEAFVSGIAKIFPRVPHRYCANHFLRDLAKPILEEDSHAKVQMRRKVRGLRDIEKRLLKEQNSQGERGEHAAQKVNKRRARTIATGSQTDNEAEARSVVFDYCGAVRGILNNDQGGPLMPPGLRMAQALEQVRQSIERSATASSGSCKQALRDLVRCIDKGTSEVSLQLKEVETLVFEVREVHAILAPQSGSARSRKAKYRKLAERFSKVSDPIHQHMARTMSSFEPGLFAAGDDRDLPIDNLDLERTFRLPKSHERRIHGHAHAGVRIVQQGPSLMLVLDGHARHPGLLSYNDLAPYANAAVPEPQLESERRRAIMRLARSDKTRNKLLADIEDRLLRSIRAT